MEPETQAAPGKRLVRGKRGQRHVPPQRVPLGEGVALTVRPLNAIAHSRILAQAMRESSAISEGKPTQRDWELTAEEAAEIAADPDAQAALMGWMRSVLIAEASVTAVEGVEDEDGVPQGPDFALFVWLLDDAQFEAKFSLVALAAERLYVAEGNASGRGPNGSGATASTIAADAAPSTNPAPEAALPSTQTDSLPGDALSSNMPPAPISATSPGASAPEAAASGAAPE